MKKRIKVLFQVFCIKAGLLGVISDFLKKLVDDKVGNFLGQFKKFLRGELIEKIPECIWTTWKTIKLGSFKTNGDLYNAIKGFFFKGSVYRGLVEETTSYISLSSTMCDIDLILLSRRELNLKGYFNCTDICIHAVKIGLDLCPAEVGPQLRIQYNNQPKGMKIIVGMINTESNCLYYYLLQNHKEQGQVIDAWEEHYDLCFDEDSDFYFVFARRK